MTNATESPVRRPPSPATGPVRTFALCLVASVIASGLPLPFAMGASVFLVVGAVAGVRALVLLGREGGRRGVVVLVSGLLCLCALLLLGEVARIAFWPAYSDFERCSAGAITESGADACEEEFRSRIVSGLLPPTR